MNEPLQTTGIFSWKHYSYFHERGTTAPAVGSYNLFEPLAMDSFSLVNDVTCTGSNSFLRF